jgi:hypothetical protein
LDAVVEKCLLAELHSRTKETQRLLHYACRGQHSVKALDGSKYRGAYSGSKNTRRTKALQRLRKASIAGVAFERINSATIRIDQPHKKAVGWLMEVAWPAETKKQRWVACVGNHRSEPLPLEGAKTAAKSLLSTKGKAEPRDWIKELNQIATNEVDRAYWAKEKRKWPIDLMGGQRHGKKQPPMGVKPELRQAILDTERIVRDDEPASNALEDITLEHYEDGFPKLPACLDRKRAENA